MLIVITSGFFVGVVYGLLAVGLVLIYRGTRVINFAYGETGMLSAFFFYELWTDRHLPLGLALVACVALAAAIGAAMDILVVRPLRNAPRLTTTVATFAIGALFITYAGRRWGLNPQYVQPLLSGRAFGVGDLQVQWEQVLIVALALAVTAILVVVYQATALGLRLKASALDPYAAGLVGVNVDRTSTLVWAVASGLSGLSAILIASVTTFQITFMTQFALRAVAAALIGGLTSIGGALSAGILIGVAEAVIAFKAPITGINEVLLAGLMIVLLIARPQGLIRSAY
jgi:branched-chain amino acid transport system permease protein